MLESLTSCKLQQRHLGDAGKVVCLTGREFWRLDVGEQRMEEVEVQCR